jgi:tRNA threonylcarbamoyladenosine biosynthesis protein TsaB
MLVLGIDTALPACSVALIDGDRTLAAASEPMQRGHQERLAPMVAEVVSRSGAAMADLDRIVVTVGPGSFTGLRVGLAFAKAMALALDRPCVGVGSLAALAATAARSGLVAAAIDAKRGQVYLQVFDGEAPITAPAALDMADAAARLLEATHGRPLVLIGSGGALLAGLTPAALLSQETADPAVVARLGARAPLVPARPLYLRAADARLPA